MVHSKVRAIRKWPIYYDFDKSRDAEDGNVTARSIRVQYHSRCSLNFLLAHFHFSKCKVVIIFKYISVSNSFIV